MPLCAILFSTSCLASVCKSWAYLYLFVVYILPRPTCSDRGRQSNKILLVKAEKHVMRAKMLAKNI